MFTNNGSFDHQTVNLEFAIASANRLKPAFVVITGDLINDPASVARGARPNNARFGAIAVLGLHTGSDGQAVPRASTRRLLRLLAPLRHLLRCSVLRPSPGLCRKTT